MNLKKIAKEQPSSFEFSKDNMHRAKEILKKYPNNKKASAVMPLLFLVQKQNDNWIPLVALKYIAKFLDMPYMKVYEVVTFYSMYNLSPVGKYFVQVCTTTPCMIRGASKIAEVCKRNISQDQNKLSKNEICSWTEVECLGACVNAPMIQINDDYFEDLDEKTAENIIQMLLNDKLPKSGSSRNRKNTAPEHKRTSLTGLKNA